MTPDRALPDLGADNRTGEKVKELRDLGLVLMSSPKILITVLVCLAIAAATEPALAWLIKTALDWPSSPGAGLDHWMLPFVLLAIFLVRGCATAGAAHLVGRLGADAVSTLQRRLYRQLLSSSLSGALTAPGKLVHLIVFEIKQCSDLIERVFTKLVKHILSIAALFVYLAYLDWRLTLAATLVLPPFCAVCVVLGKRLRLASQQYIRQNEKLADTAIEMSAMTSIVKLHGTRASEQGAFASLAGLCRIHALRVYAMAAAAAPLTQMIVVLVFALIAVYLFSQVGEGARTRGNAAAFLTNLLLLLAPLKNLAELNGPILRSLTGIGAVMNLRDLPLDRTGGKAPVSVVEGKIAFRDVSFFYPDKAEHSLAGLNFTINPGELVAVVGASGVGKSTLFKLLCGALAPKQGRIYVDDVAIDQCSLEWIRANITVVSQEVLILNLSIEENVAYGIEDPDPARVRGALAAAQLLDHVDGLPQGVFTRLGNDGVRLSRGQRQQIAIARAFYKDPPILLLDECTASLDDKSEIAVIQALKDLRQRKTTLMITHRLAAVDLADRVMYLDPAGLVYGSHNHLAATNIHYNALIVAQVSEHREWTWCPGLDK